MAKPHMHILMTQMSIKQGIKAFGERGNDALLKELNQLHEQKALLPLRKEDISYEQMKSTTLSNVPERNAMTQSKPVDVQMGDHSENTQQNQTKAPLPYPWRQ